MPDPLATWRFEDSPLAIGDHLPTQASRFEHRDQVGLKLALTQDLSTQSGHSLKRAGKTGGPGCCDYIRALTTSLPG